MAEENKDLSSAGVSLYIFDIKDIIYVVRIKQVMIDTDLAMLYQVETKRLNEAGELLRLIEVGASCFNHYCTGCDFSQRSVLHNVHRRIRSGYSIPTFCLCC